MLKPGDRVTWKYDSRICYGTVIESQLRDSEKTFVVWDRYPDIFKFYDYGEIRLVRKNEEINYPENKEV